MTDAIRAAGLHARRFLLLSGMEIHPIRNDDDHAAAIREIEKLWGAGRHKIA
jgi:hypothetical protein